MSIFIFYDLAIFKEHYEVCTLSVVTGPYDTRDVGILININQDV